MNTIRSIRELRATLQKPRRSEQVIGLVPTMGALHEGHLSLLRRARRQCDVVVMSLFVNPAQFNEATDLASYPRDEERDLALAEREGVDLAASYFYTDSITDLPLLEAVGHPRVVCPDVPLRRLARRRGWPVVWPKLGEKSALPLAAPEVEGYTPPIGDQGRSG